MDAIRSNKPSCTARSAHSPSPPANAPRVVLADGTTRREVFPPVIPGNYPAYYANIREALHGRAHLAVRPEEVLASVHLIEAATESARCGAVVQLPA